MTALTELAREVAHRPALAYHYDRLARGAWPAGEAGSAPIRLKTLFYALPGGRCVRRSGAHAGCSQAQVVKPVASLAAADALLLAAIGGM